MMTPCDENPLQPSVKLRDDNKHVENDPSFLSALPNRSQSVGSSSVSSETHSWRASSSCRSISGYIENGSFSTNSFDPVLSINDELDGAASMNNVFTYQELTQTSPDSESQLLVTVDRPEKVLATLDTFITFRVVTRVVKHTAFTHPEHHVRRRYSDFAWLRQRIEAQSPFSLLPALPEKHSVYSLDRFDPDFIKFRCMGLHLFINWLIKHVSLSENADLLNFLRISDSDEWSAYRKTSIPTAMTSVPSTTSLGQKSFVGGDPIEKEYYTHSDYCLKLAQTLSSLEKMSMKLMKSEQDCWKDMDAFQVVFNYWGESENSPSLKLAAVSAAAALSANVECLSATSRRFEPQFIVPAHLFALYSESVRTVLRKRDTVETEHKNALESLQKKNVEYELLLKSIKPAESNGQKYFNNGSSRSKDNNDTKLIKVELQVKELTKKVEKCSIALKAANSDVQTELTHWHELKDSELRRLIATMAKERVLMHQKCLSSWGEAFNISTSEHVGQKD